MFRRPNIHVHTHSSSVTSSHSVTVTEKRAPTDDSVRLLSEMEQAAERRVIDRIRVEDTIIDTVVQIAKDYESDGFIIVAVADINGDRVEVTARPRRSSVASGEYALWEKLRDELALAIAAKALAPAFEKWCQRSLP